MTTGVVAIFVSEHEYAERLMEYLEDRAGLPFKTIAFTVKEELQKYLEKEKIDLLLISMEEMSEEIGHNIKRIVLLSAGTIVQKFEKYSTIFKYQSMENIIREMLEHYLEVTSESDVITHKSEAEIIGVYSPIGNKDKTVFALTLGQILASDKKVLYLNLEEFSAFENLMNAHFSGDLADLMYFYGQNKEVLSVKLQAIVRTINRLDYVPPLTFSEDLRNLEVNQWLELLEKITVTSGYNVIVIDFGNMVKDFLGILEICNIVYLPVNNNLVQRKRVEAFEEYILKVGKEDILKRIEKIQVPYVEADMWSEEYFEELKWSPLGDFIREIVKEEKWSLRN